MGRDKTKNVRSALSRGWRGLAATTSRPASSPRVVADAQRDHSVSGFGPRPSWQRDDIGDFGRLLAPNGQLTIARENAHQRVLGMDRGVAHDDLCERRSLSGQAITGG
jgi:hypothetical protein